MTQLSDNVTLHRCELVIVDVSSVKCIDQAIEQVYNDYTMSFTGPDLSKCSCTWAPTTKGPPPNLFFKELIKELILKFVTIRRYICRLTVYSLT